MFETEPAAAENDRGARSDRDRKREWYRFQSLWQCFNGQAGNSECSVDGRQHGGNTQQAPNTRQEAVLEQQSLGAASAATK